MSSALPSVSVVVPTHDRRASLFRLLTGLADGTIPPDRFEVIVVADGCSDDTIPSLQHAEFPFAFQAIEVNPGRGPATARNVGARVARAPLLLFLDDDIEPLPTLLEAHLAEHAEAGPSLVIGAPLPVRFSGVDLHAVAIWGWWDQRFEQMELLGHRFRYDEVFGAILSLARDLFVSLEGFDESFNGCREDPELGLRLIQRGVRVAFSRAGGGYHHGLRNRPQMIARKRAEGVADVLLAERYPDVWDSLQLSRSAGGPRGLGLVRYLAFHAPRLGSLIFRAISPVLNFVERRRFRRWWRALQGGTFYFAYWRGVAQQLGGGSTAVARLSKLADSAASASASEPEGELDLAEGFDKAEARLDRERPRSARVFLGDIELGTLSPVPGGELLAGRHLRRSLVDSLAWPLRTALAMRSVREQTPIFSIIIPAFDAAGTLPETLDSVLAQTEPRWEIVVIDDGSKDRTGAVVAGYAERDPRIRLLHQENAGPSAARNAGIQSAQAGLLLFLDADDRIAPSMLARMRLAFSQDPGLDAVHCGWEIEAPDGKILERGHCSEVGDLFPGLARRCLFPIHACVIRHRLVAEAGGFSTEVGHCEDWLLWQRAARLGARFGSIPDYLVSYRQRATSRSADSLGLFIVAEHVIRLGHGTDPALPAGTRRGSEVEADFEQAWLQYLYWAATTMILAGRDPEALLQRKGAIGVPLDPDVVGDALFQPLVPHLPCEPPRNAALCTAVWSGFQRFLAQLAGAVRVEGFERSVLRRLDRRLANLGALDRPYHLGLTQVVDIDVTDPLEDIPADPAAELFHASISVAGVSLGALELPVCEASIPGWLLADAICDRFAWSILEGFFEAEYYRRATFHEARDGTVSAALDGRVIATGLPPDPTSRASALHDQAGWLLFVDQLWSPESGEALQRTDARSPVAVEVSSPTPKLPDAGPYLIELRVGGWPAGLVEVSGPLDAASFRARLTDALGLELCRVAVREAIVGRPLAGASLRERLAILAVNRRRPEPISGSWAPGTTIALERAFGAGTAGFALGRRNSSAPGTAADRGAVLPLECADQIVRLETTIGTPAIEVLTGPSTRFAYVPNLVTAALPNSANVALPDAAAALKTSFRFDFEATFARGADPWRYGTEYEQVKYRQTLDLLPHQPIRRALELACAEGHFTMLLAGRVSRLMATDISEIALERAADRCQDRDNIEFQRLDLRRDPLPGEFDLIVCSEVLYYLTDETELRQVAQKMAGALADGGHLLTAHAKTIVDEPDHTGFDWTTPFGSTTIARVLSETMPLRLVTSFETPLYRIQLHARSDAGPVIPAKSIISPDYVLPREEVAARIRWSFTDPAPARPRVVESSRLPILMYHRIVPTGHARGDRYRLTPAAFEEQLRFLSECGFYSIHLDQWRHAAGTRRPMPGRPIILTFDDGFADFEEHAWPLLQRFGFGALVFLVTGSVGRWNEWDTDAGEERLMDWPAIVRLRAQGVEFGAHGVRHARSTGISPAALVNEAIGSRVAIEQWLGEPVRAFAYPYGDEDEAARHLIGASGFSYGLTNRDGWTSALSPLLALPRLEITGDLDLPGFIARMAFDAEPP